MSKKTTYCKTGYLHENFRLFHLRDTSGQELDFHFHEFDKIVILISGVVKYKVEDAVCDMQPWDVVLVKHHSIHKAEIDRSVTYERVIIYLDSKYIERAAPESGLLSCFDEADKRRQYLLRPKADEKESIKKIISELERSLEDDDFGAEVMRSSSMMQLLVTLDRMTIRDRPERNSLHRDGKLDSILSYINENLEKDLSVESLAEMAYMSRFHFMRLFKAQTGTTVHGYVRQKRLLRAAQLIRDGVPITKAAAECGFNDYSAFHRAFKDTFNISPAKLKR